MVQDGRILLLRDVDPISGVTTWAPPGGGLEEADADLAACARRETKEETGLTVEILQMMYVREFWDRGRGVLHLEAYFLAKVVSGTLTLEHLEVPSAVAPNMV